VSEKQIRVRGAKVHNLQNLSVDIPRESLVTITGVSGSGKSSLAFDTIYAEGQRRYVESLSTYARQFLQMMTKPDVESIEGLSPAISIDQKSASRNPRSTVGTVTEIYDYMRLLYAKIGKPHCILCGKEIQKQSVSQIVQEVSMFPLDTKILVLAPVVFQKYGSHEKVFENMKQNGFTRARVNGEIVPLNKKISLDENLSHTIEIVVDRLVIKDYSPKKTPLQNGSFLEEVNPDKARLSDSLELALKHGNGGVQIVNYDTGESFRYSENYSCPDHPEINIPFLEPRSFSFNSPHGACEHCHGLGVCLVAKKEAVVLNDTLTLAEGAIHPFMNSSWYSQILEAMALFHKINLHIPFKKLSKEHQNMVLYGTGKTVYQVKYSSRKLQGDFSSSYEGAIPMIERRFTETDSESSKKSLEKYMTEEVCPVCEGKKLKKEILGVTVFDKNIIELTSMSIMEAHKFFTDLSSKLSQRELSIVHMILEEVLHRLEFLIHVGVPYLTLERSANTLSGGEAQRIRLATQIGSALLGVLYVLDEPSIGLHQKDNGHLIDTLKSLRNLGNTVLVVEHDEETMLASDRLIEIGPGAGSFGGKLVAEGTPQEIMQHKTSLTGAFLSGREKIEIPQKRREGTGNILTIHKASAHNLKNITVDFPLGTFIGVSGVSGSGKSTLINGILAAELLRMLNRAETVGLTHEKITGVEHLDKIIHIDQSPIGRTPRSNPATYTGVFTDIRALFASQPEAKLRGYDAGRFSFNVKGGRCEVCAGDGVKKIEMHFLPDVYVPCDVCKGKRYNEEALEIKWRGKTIADVLDMTAGEALEHFSSLPSIKQKLQTLKDVGLDYIKLGQGAPTLSGGEAQRVKLATELSKRSTGKTLYILDEPTVGLHFYDVRKLLEVIQRLVDSGNTVIVIEHNLDVLKTCDYLIDIGPLGGNTGGQVIAFGTPEEVSKEKKSFTGQYLKKMLENHYKI
jgi:excinuclease ABC subunit A